MPIHYCLDPRDLTARAEILIEFETTAGEVRLLSALNAMQDDVLADMQETQREALVGEIADDYRPDRWLRDLTQAKLRSWRRERVDQA